MQKAKEERDAAKQTYLQEAEKSSESDSNVKSAQEAAQNAQKKFDEAKSAADDLKVQQSKKQQDLLDAQVQRMRQLRPTSLSNRSLRKMNRQSLS